MADRSVRAPYGQKTIELRVRFWTDNLAAGRNMVLPRQGWDSGVVHTVANEAHGIEGGNPVTFNSLAELPAAIERLLIKRGIQLHRNQKSRKYLL